MPTQTYDDLRTVLVDKPEPRIGVLTFNRPEKRNSISPEFSREMNIVLDRILFDDPLDEPSRLHQVIQPSCSFHVMEL